jgi:hypothetical protein
VSVARFAVFALLVMVVCLAFSLDVGLLPGVVSVLVVAEIVYFG